MRRGAIAAVCAAALWPMVWMGVQAVAAEPAPSAHSYLYLRGIEGPVMRDPAEIEAAREWMHEIRQDWLPIDMLTAEQRSRAFQGQVYLILSVDVDGGVTGCEILKSDLTADQGRDICARLTTPSRFERRFVDVGQPIAWQATFKVVARTVIRTPPVAVRAPPAMPPPYHGPRAPQWPRLNYWGSAYIAAFPRLGDGLPRGVRAEGRTSVEVAVNAADGVTGCEVIQASGQPILDDIACSTARTLPFRYARMMPGSTSDAVPLQFVWDKKNSHIRVPLASERSPPVVHYDPLDPREHRRKRQDARPLTPISVPREALDGIILMTSLFRKPLIYIDYDVAGKPTHCYTGSTSGDPEVDVAICRHASNAWRFQPAEDVFGDPIAGKWSGMVAF